MTIRSDQYLNRQFFPIRFQYILLNNFSYLLETHQLFMRPKYFCGFTLFTCSYKILRFIGWNRNFKRMFILNRLECTMVLLGRFAGCSTPSTASRCLYGLPRAITMAPGLVDSSSRQRGWKSLQLLFSLSFMDFRIVMDLSCPFFPN